MKVAELSGTANKRSDVFHLQGGQQRITYTVNGTTYPMLYIYLVEAAKSLETHGGIAEVMAQESGDTLGYRGAGDYYLDITAVNSDWTVIVEEKQ